MKGNTSNYQLPLFINDVAVIPLDVLRIFFNIGNSIGSRQFLTSENMPRVHVTLLSNRGV